MSLYGISAKDAVDAINLALQAGGVFQDRTYHSADVQLSKDLHKEEVELAKELHEREVRQAKKYHETEMGQAEKLHKYELETSKKIYLWDASTQMEQHLQQLNADLISANREADRDMYEQRNSQFQTIIVSATVMFAALCTVIIEGTLPVDSGRLIEAGMAIFAGSSFSLLFLSIVLSLEIVFRTTRYMYERARVHNSTLVGLVIDTKEVMQDLEDMRKLGMIRSPEEVDAAFNQHYQNLQKFMGQREKINNHMFEGQGMGDTATKDRRQKRQRQPFGEIRNKQRHESEDYNRATTDSQLYKMRDAIRRWQSLGRSPKSEFDDDDDERSSSSSSTSQVRSFSDFWDKHCKIVSNAALFSFYAGTSLLLLDISVFTYAKFKFNYNNESAAWITAGFVFAALFCALVVLTFMRCGSHKIFHGYKAALAKQQQEHDEDEDVSSFDGEELYRDGPVESGGGGARRRRQNQSGERGRQVYREQYRSGSGVSGGRHRRGGEINSGSVREAGDSKWEEEATYDGIGAGDIERGSVGVAMGRLRNHRISSGAMAV